MEVLKQGRGPLFLSPDPFAFREQRRAKNRGQRPKITSVAEAVARYIHDGDYLATGGFGTNRIPVALLHEIVRQRRKDLGFAGHSTTHDYQILSAGAGLNRVDVAYIVGLEARGLSPAARRALQEKDIRLCEWSNASLGWRLSAGARGIPFFPTYVTAGTDTFERSAAKLVQCPFTGLPIVLVPALNPDVGLLHVHKADELGNCEIRGITVADAEVAAASRVTLVTCEQLVPTDYFREDPRRTTIPWIHVDAVSEVPCGSYPGNMPGLYYSDEKHLAEWLESEKDPEGFRRFLEHYLYSSRTFEEYLEKCGGQRRIEELRHAEL
jgi:glutaconate CoA-transferase subunit A